jgi:hypothetical protein
MQMSYFMDISYQEREFIKIVVDGNGMALFTKAVSVITQFGLSAFGDCEMEGVFFPELVAVLNGFFGQVFMKNIQQLAIHYSKIKHGFRFFAGWRIKN